MRVKEITSPQNPLIKSCVLLLQKKKERRKQKAFLVEGFREVQRAILSGYEVESLFYRSDLLTYTQVIELLSHSVEFKHSKPMSLSESTKPSLLSDEHIGYLHQLQHIHCSSAVFQKLAYRSEVVNIVALVKSKPSQQLPILKAYTEQNNHDLTQASTPTIFDSSQRNSPPFILILEGVEKPGNLGAILRSADAFGVHGVILVNCSADIEHPNTIRNSLGAALALDILELTLTETYDTLEEANIPIYVTYLHASSKEPSQLPLQQACAFVLGAESTGASEQWLIQGAQATLIPMVPQRVIDSLNVSVASAIIMYEVQRQRMGSLFSTNS